MNVFSCSLSPFLMASSPRLCRLQLPPPDIKEKRSDSESTCGGSSQHRGVTDWLVVSTPLKNISQMMSNGNIIPNIYIWVWVNTYRYIFSGMNIHLPAILGFTRYQPGFWPIPIWEKKHVPNHQPADVADGPGALGSPGVPWCLRIKETSRKRWGLFLRHLHAVPPWTVDICGRWTYPLII